MKDTMTEGMRALLKGVPAAKRKNLKNTFKKLLDKANKDKGITGKPKGRSPSMVLGSSSKAGMQNKQKSPFNVKVTSPKVRRPNRLDNQRRRLVSGSGPRRKS